MLAKSPAFALIAVATLAIGIGLNTAMFSVVHTVLVKPLPYSDPDRIVAVMDANPAKNFLAGAVSPANFLDWQSQNKSLSAIAAYAEGSSTLTGYGEAKQVPIIVATPQLFNVLQAKPLLGRGFVPEDGVKGKDHVVVLSHHLWQQSFGSDGGIVGKSIQLDSEPYTVVGVMPASFQFPLAGSDLWFPLSFGPDVMSQRGAHYLATIARLKDGVSLQQAQSDLRQIAARLEKQYPKTNEGYSVAVETYRDYLVGDVRGSLLVLLGAVGFVVLIACVNVANLLLARSAGRERELAIRSALGAARSRIIRQLLTESGLLSVIGAALGLMLATWLQTAISSFGPKDVPLIGEVGISLPILMFAAGLTLLTTMLFGILPAWRAAAVAPHSAMRSGAMGSLGGKRQRTMRNSLVVAEVALSLMLLVGAGLLIRSFQKLSGIDPGFDSSNVLTFSIAIPEIHYKDAGQINTFFDDVMARFRATPGVESVGTINMLPLGSDRFSSSFYVDDAADDNQSAQLRIASEGYFETLHIPLVRGRLFTAADRMGSQKVVLITASGARKLFAGMDPIGHQVRFGARPGSEKISGVIVGVVGDVHDLGLAVAPPPMFYAPLLQSATTYTNFVIRTKGTPEGLLNSLMAQLRAVDPNVPVDKVAPLTSLVRSSVSERRFYMLLLGLFASVALLLSIVGIYGVISYSVAQRTQEIGLRVALGARQHDIVQMVLREATRMVAGGIAVGLLSAALLTRFLGSLLFGVSRHDPLTMIGVSSTLIAFALFASYWPARRATRVDPMIALRSE
jgi:putative ABC transport system permease protein